MVLDTIEHLGKELAIFKKPLHFRPTLFSLRLGATRL